MECPKCGYILTAFDVDCPRCKRLGEPQRLPPMPLVSDPAPVAPPEAHTPAQPATSPLKREIHPVYFLFLLSLLLPLVAFIVGIVYLCKSDMRDRNAGLVAVVVSSIVMTLWLNRLN